MREHQHLLVDKDLLSSPITFSVPPMNEATQPHGQSLDGEIRLLENIIADIQNHRDLKSLLLRIVSLQQAVFDEINRRNRQPLQ